MKYCPKCHAVYPKEFEFCPNDNSAVVPQGLWAFFIPKGFQRFRNSLSATKAAAVGAFLLAAVLLMTFWRGVPGVPGAVPVEITAIPLGTTVKIKSTGQECVTPHCSIKLRPGKHDVEFSYPGYTTQTQTIPVQAKGPNKFALELESPGSPGTTKPHLAENRPPSPTTAASTKNKPPITDLASMRIRGWNKGSEVFLDNNPIGTIGSAGIFSSITPGVHEIKVVDKKGESGTMQKRFASGERADLTKKDFALPPPPPMAAQPTNTEEHDWQQVKDSINIAELEKFRSSYPNTRYKADLEDKLDDLYWKKANKHADPFDNFWTLHAYLQRYPNGKHHDEAQEDLDSIRSLAVGSGEPDPEYVRFHEAWDSGDEALLQSFLKDYPSGDLHDKISQRLDDVLWKKTRKDDWGSLQAYIAKMPAGRHISQARNYIENVTAPKPVNPVEQELNRLSPGEILFNPASEMTQGRTERIEVRLIKNSFADASQESTQRFPPKELPTKESLMKGLQGKGNPQVEPVRVSTFMKVGLSGDGFRIDALDTEEQVVDSGTYSQWAWNVTPQRTGNRSLHLRVAARVHFRGYPDGTKDVAVMDRDIMVRVDAMYWSKELLRNYWHLVALILVLLFGVSWWRIRHSPVLSPTAATKRESLMLAHVLFMDVVQYSTLPMDTVPE